ncbi:sel1 repeat family protein [Halopseudomonas nanhaiensis]|uniref:tetratricopeptide repeat protein n=1 Tax=Halopseudomonas nanhaiensis TaxID=2830842 RepID=UPI001CBC37FA|nr:tetratricopeptide repeat protein [Halopseudomonas nanhaiensis]UAW99375.1 sel1 repeat family protein [Halopseudomonas nanhaiensis]
MRVVPVFFILAAVLGTTGCAGSMERSGDFLSRSGAMLANQGKRLAEFAGGLVNSQDDKRYQQEIDTLFAQSMIDPLTRYLETHSADSNRARQLQQVVAERDRRCSEIGRTYAGRDATPANLQRMRGGYLYSCPDEVQTFALRVEQQQRSAPVVRQAVEPRPSAEPQPASQVSAEPPPSLELASADFADALNRKRNSNCYLLFTIKNYTQALEACRQPAERGDAKAQHHMGSVSLARRDYRSAVAWAERSAAQQHAPGLLLLGRLYQDGQGVGQDQSRGLALIQQAADKGLAEARFNAGLAYLNGIGTASDATRAERYLKLAAIDGHMASHLSLAALHESRGEPQQARYWLRQAARKGSAEAQFLLGQSYAHGKGGVVDNQEAYVWYSLALLNGNTQAKSEIDRQQALLSKDQLSAAKTRIQDGINGKWQ